MPIYPLSSIPFIADGCVVDLDPNLSPRHGTVATLWDRIQQVGVVHIRGTPACGKSTLARFLEDHVRTTRPSLPVYRFSWPVLRENDKDNEKLRSFQYRSFEHSLNFLTGLSQSQIRWQTSRFLLIIDEAQGSYRYMSLWNDLIKGLSPTSGPLIVLFSSYGSASDTPLGEIRTPTPIFFSSNQRVSIRRSTQHPDLALLFSLTEFSDVVARVCRSYSQDGQAFRLSSELIDYIWELTNGHPAGVRAVLDELANSEVSIGCSSILIFICLTKFENLVIEAT